MKFFEPTYLTLLVASFIRWMALAKDMGTWSVATILSILTCFYMYERYRDTRAARKLKEQELVKLTESKENE